MKFLSLALSVSGSTQSYPDAMAMAGPNYQHFTELTNDVQKLSVLETPPSTGQGMPTFIPSRVSTVLDFLTAQQLKREDNFQKDSLVF